MTWHETHERTRIVREVEAHAATDVSGHLPWQDAWAPYFGSRDGLLTALRSRWDRTCQSQLDSDAGEAAFQDTLRRLRRSNAGVLRILEAHAPRPVAAAAVS